MSKKRTNKGPKAKSKSRNAARRTGAGRRRPPDASAALLELGRPLFDLVGDDATEGELEDLFIDVALVWDVAVHEHLFGETGVADRFLVSGVPRGVPSELARTFEAILQRKREERPFDARWIGWVDVALEADGDIGIRAEWAPPDALTREDAEDLMDALAEIDPLLAWDDPAGIAGPGPADRTSPADAATVRGAPRGADPWPSILVSARDIHALAPWEVHLDRDVFGLRVDGEPDVHWCSVMGAAGEFFGVSLCRGAEGFGVLRGLALDGDPEAGFAGFDGFLLSFNDREDLTAAERRRIKEAGVRFRGRGAWPQIHLQRKGRLPAELRREDEERLQPLMEALVLALDARCDRAGPQGTDLDGELPVYELGPYGLALRFERPGEPPGVELPPVDQVGVARLLAKADRADAVLEFGGVAMPARIEDDDGFEYVPYLFLAADATTGVLLPPRITEIGTREAECAAHLLGILSEAEVLPREIHVVSDWIERGIAPTAEALSIRLVRCSEMVMFEEAAASMVSFMDVLR